MPAPFAALGAFWSVATLTLTLTLTLLLGLLRVRRLLVGIAEYTG